MASGDQASTSRKKPSGKKAKKLSQKEQSERFLETARKLGADETGTSFDNAVKAVLHKNGKSPDKPHGGAT